MKHAGKAVYNRLMDLALTLQDIDEMGPLCLFLGTLPDESEALAKLRGEVEAFIARLDSLIIASKRG